jgi:hypothetical protein
MRMVEQMARMLARILFLKEEGRREEAFEEIEHAFGDVLGLDAALFDTVPVENIAELLGILQDSSTGGMKCIVAGRLLSAKADSISSGDHAQSTGYCRKALALYLTGFMNIGYTEIDLTEYRDDMKKLENKLKGLIPDEELRLLRKFSGSGT